MNRSLITSLILFATLPLHADADFIYSDFSDTTGLTLNGSAASVGSALRLVPATTAQRGSVFTDSLIHLGPGNSFRTYFQFRISGSGGTNNGADGLVFVVQSNSNNSIGSTGGGIGYYGISNSIGIEFDTYRNGGFVGDPNGNHVGVNTNGSITSIATRTEPVSFKNGRVWHAWVDYDGAVDWLEIRWSLDEMRPVASQLSVALDLESLVGSNSAFVGFTSGTATGYGNHDILHWEFQNMAAVPEPSSLALAATGLLGGLGLYVRRRRRATAS